MGKDILGELGALAGRVEAAATDAVARVAPWASPLPTAYLTARATVEHLGWSDALGLVAGLIIESLGLAATATALMLWEYNRGKRKSDPVAPFVLAGVLVGMYFVSVVALTVVLDTAPALAMYAPLIFPVLSLAGVTVLALRADHRRRVEGIEADRRKRLGGRSGGRSGSGQVAGRVAGQAAGQADQAEAGNSGSLARANRQRRLNRDEALDGLVAFFAENPTASHRVAGIAIGRSKSWVTGAIGDLEKEGRLQRNGDGVEVVG